MEKWQVCEGIGYVRPKVSARVPATKAALVSEWCRPGRPCLVTALCHRVRLTPLQVSGYIYKADLIVEYIGGAPASNAKRGRGERIRHRPPLASTPRKFSGYAVASQDMFVSNTDSTPHTAQHTAQHAAHSSQLTAVFCALTTKSSHLTALALI